MKLRWPVARVVLILLILVGAVMVGIGVKALLDGRRFNATAVEARGTVVEVANVREYDADLEREVTRPYPVVEFVTAGEQGVRYQPPVGSNPPDPGRGGPPPPPVLRVFTAGEQVLRSQPPVGSNPPDYRLGGPLTVLYDPAD